MDNIFLRENHTTKQILHYSPKFKMETYEHACVYMYVYECIYMCVCIHMCQGNSRRKARNDITQGVKTNHHEVLRLEGIFFRIFHNLLHVLLF